MTTGTEPRKTVHTFLPLGDPFLQVAVEVTEFEPRPEPKITVTRAGIRWHYRVEWPTPGATSSGSISGKRWTYLGAQQGAWATAWLNRVREVRR